MLLLLLLLLLLLFNETFVWPLTFVDLWKGRKALREPPPTKIVADGRKICFDSLLIDFVDKICWTFDNELCSPLVFLRVIWIDEGIIFGLGGTTATGGIWFVFDRVCVGDKRCAWVDGKLWLRLSEICCIDLDWDACRDWWRCVTITGWTGTWSARKIETKLISLNRRW